jgi:hypothetical protein
MAAVTESRAQFFQHSHGAKRTTHLRIANIREMVPGSQQRGQDANQCRLTFMVCCFGKSALGQLQL